MDIDLLVKVTSRAWSLTILALMHDGTPGRQASLLAASGAGRTAFAQSLTHLVELGLLERNPGHGHPLRPEFRLTEAGIAMASVAARIERSVSRPPEIGLLRRAWTVPILSVSREPSHFTDIKNRLMPISDRALSQSLKLLQTQDWLQRTVDTDEYPVRPRYRAINAGALIGRTVGLQAH